jgi:hypothetical protein
MANTAGPRSILFKNADITCSLRVVKHQHAPERFFGKTQPPSRASPLCRVIFIARRELGLAIIRPAQTLGTEKSCLAIEKQPKSIGFVKDF